jgi:3-oxoacyl-[acyl-carrier protein] reductase
VTGAGAGFGRATAVGLAREGARFVGLVEQHADRLEAVAAEVTTVGARPIPIAVDLRDPITAATVIAGRPPRRG